MDAWLLNLLIRRGGAGFGAGTPLAAFALDSKIAYLGDSNTEFALTLTGSTVGHDIRSHAAWVGPVTSSIFYEPNTTTAETIPNRGGNLGYGGQTAASVAARAGDAVTKAAKVVVVLSGTNDLLGSSTASDITTAWATTHATLRAGGCRIVQATIPKAGGTAAWSAPKEAIRVSANNTLKALATADLLVVDSDLYLTGDTHFVTNEVHFSNLGAKLLGYALGQAMVDAGWVDASTLPTTLWTDATSFHTNLALSGTGGSHIGAASTGSVPTNCFADANSAGSGATLVCTKDGSDKPVLTLGGTYTGSTRYLELFNNQTTDLPTTGDVVEGLIDFEITTALTNVVSVDGVLEVQTSGFSMILRLDTGAAFRQSAFPLGVGRYQFRSPACVIPAGTIGRVISRARLLLLDGTSLSPTGAIKIHKVALRKVT